MIQATLGKIYTWAVSLGTVRPFWVSWVLGGIVALSMPPIGAWFLLPIAFSGFLILLEQSESLKSTFWVGWLFGFGYFFGSLYWMAYGPATLGLWMVVPLAAVAIPMGLAFFPALACVSTFWVRSRLTPSSVSYVFIFTIFWSVSEWLRGHVLTGLPWNLLGYTWDTTLLQVTSVIGIYGLTALTVLAASIFATRHRGWILTVLFGLGVLWIWGDYRLTQSPISSQKAEDGADQVNLRIVQASISQQTKWLAEHFQENLERYIALSHLKAEKPLIAVIWPESSVPTLVEKSPALLQRLAEAAPPGGILLFGAPREVGQHLRTSMIGLDDQGKIVGTYDKSHLVPFGEYMPLRSILPFKKLTYGDQDYTSGSGIQTISFPGLPAVSPLICYEAIFPHEVTEGRQRPYWMLNMTNDAWYGHSAGPYQHFQIVRVRAIEEGIPLVRSANNGISGVIDAFGRVIDRLELDEVGFIDFSLPKRLEYVTVYQRWGDLPFSGIMVVLLILAITYRHHHKKIIKKA